MRNELDEIRARYQTEIDDLRIALNQSDAKNESLGIKLAKSRVRSDEAREQLDAERETVLRMQSTIKNLKRDRDGRIQKRFQEKEDRSDSDELSEYENDDSPASKRSRDDEKTTFIDRENLDEKTSVSSGGGGISRGTSGKLQFALTPRDFHRPTLKDTHYSTIKKYAEDIEYCNTCGLSYTRDNDRTTEIPSKALEKTIDMQFKAKANASKLGELVVKHWKDRSIVSDERFVQALKQVFDSGSDQSASNSFEGLRTRVNELEFKNDPHRQATAADSIRKLLEIEEDTRDMSL